MIDKENIPASWEVVKLGEVCEIIMGQSPSSSTYNRIGKGLPFFQGKKEFTDLHPVVEKWCTEPNKIAEPNDILLSVRAPVGATNIANETCCIGRGLAAIRFPQNNLFVFYFLNLIEKQLDEKGTGTTFNAISGEVLKETEIPLPPQNEINRIVSKIEELFTELDKGIETLKTTQQQLKVYRQAVLKWAFEGKLTRLNRDLYDADDVHDNKTKNHAPHKNQKNHSADNGELPEGWEWKKLGDVSKISGGITKNSTREKHKLKLPFLRVANVYFNSLDLSNMHTIGLEEKEVERARLEVDDLIFVEGNGSIEQIGRVALWNGSVKNCVHQNHLIKARPSTLIFPKYALYFFCSKIGRDKIKLQASSTSGLHTLSLSKIQNLELPVCSKKEQEKIVKSIESRLSVCDKMEETISESLQQAEALRLSILKKAFEGKLVEQNPKDEPAAKLLEKIRAMKKAAEQRNVYSKKKSQSKHSSVGAK